MRMAVALQQLGERLERDDRWAALSLVRTKLAWTGSPKLATALAGAVMALLSPESDHDGFASLVETLKYPTVAGEASDYLLETLHRGIPDFPGKDAGYMASLRLGEREVPRH